MNNQEAIELIQAQINEIGDLVGLNREHHQFRHWYDKSLEIIKNVEDRSSRFFTDFVNLSFEAMKVPHGCTLSHDVQDDSRYEEDLNIAKTILEGIVDHLKLRKG